MKRLKIVSEIGNAASLSEPTRLSERLLSVKELAEIIGVSTRWIHERTRRHEIPCYRFGTAVRFAPEEIRTWLAQYHDTPGEREGR